MALQQSITEESRTSTILFSLFIFRAVGGILVHKKAFSIKSTSLQGYIAGRMWLDNSLEQE